MSPSTATPPAIAAVRSARIAVSVVVPCFNESESLAKLANGLESLRSELGPDQLLEVILVDDGSTDDTAVRMHQRFGGEDCVRIITHPFNRGITAAIGTGIEHARAEVVATLDADCTYDPRCLAEMLPLLTDNVDMVVASPYHPLGRVEGVSAWRLGLSRCASRLYGLVLHNQLATYTSCVRVFHRASVVNLPVHHRGFVGVVELLWQLDRRGGTIVEHPAVLKVRTTGQSKMRVARAIWAHLRLLSRAACDRLLTGRRAT